MKFRTMILGTGKSAAGIEIPEHVVDALGAGRKPPVTLSVDGYTYRSTVATVDGRFMVGLSAERRAESGLAVGDEVDVEVELDTQPRTVDLPADFAAALDADPAAKATFERLSNSLKGFHVSQITGAKTDATRQRRIEKSIAILHAGRSR